MANTLVSTKFTAPPLHRRILPRPILSAQLENWDELKMILLQAPAGFGKTTLLLNWLKQCDAPSSWFTIDERDNNPSRFFSSLVRAIRNLSPQFAEKGDDPAGCDHSDPESSLFEVLNEADMMELSGVLVLDDFHHISDPEILKTFNYFLKNLPRRLCLILLTRNKPGLSLSRLRSSRLIREIKIENFRFSSEEVKQFFNVLNGYSLSKDEISVLSTQTEGWIGGLQLVALSLERCHSPSAFIERFSGCDRLISDYLIDEVLEQLPKEVENILLVSSILDRFCAGLCRSLIDTEPEGGVQDFLEKSNLFIEPLDEQRKWYRFHRLFRDLLVDRLKNKPEDEVLAVYNRAYLWHRNEGLYEDAIRYALVCKSPEQVVSIIREIRYTATNWTGEMYRLKEWLAGMADELWQNSPPLAVLKGFANLDLGKVIRARQVLDRLLSFPNLSPGDDENCKQRKVLQGKIAALSATLVCHREADPLKTLEYTGEALKELPEDYPGDRAVAYFHQAYASIQLGKLDDARRSLDQHKSLSSDIKSLFGIILNEIGNGAYFHAKEEYGQALCHLEKARQLGCEYGVINTSPFSTLPARIALIHLKQDEMRKALDFACDRDGLKKKDEFIDSILFRHAAAIQIFCAAEEYASAREILKDTEQLCKSVLHYKVIAGRVSSLSDFISASEKNYRDDGSRENLLTDREVQILPYLVQGMEYAEIAVQLNISVNTLKYHLKNIYSKLNAENRTQAIYLAKEIGLL